MKTRAKNQTVSAPALDQAALSAIVQQVLAAIQQQSAPAPEPKSVKTSAKTTKNMILKSYARDHNPKTGRRYSRPYIDLTALARDYVVPSEVQLAFVAIRALGLYVGGFTLDEDGGPIFIKRERVGALPEWVQEIVKVVEGFLNDVRDSRVEAIPQV